MASAQTLTRLPPSSDTKSQSLSSQSQEDPQSSPPVFVPPNEFRMKLLKRILSVDGNIDKKALQRLQRHSSDRALQANILFQNGDVGTLISFDTIPDQSLFKNRPDSETTSEDTSSSLPSIQKTVAPSDPEQGTGAAEDRKKERPLKLPPIILPPIYSMQPRPLMARDFSGPPYIPPDATDEEWEELQDCRYLRPALKKYRSSNRNKLVL